MDDLIKGWQFFANLHIFTPLEVLLKHGIIVESAQQPPNSWQHGFWVPITKSWEELGFTAGEMDGLDDEIDRSFSFGAREVNTQFGMFSRDGDELLAFLKSFRKIVESDLPVADQLKWIDEAVDASGIRERLLERAGGDFGRFWFVSQLALLPGVGTKTAERLYDAGFRVAAQINTAPDEALLAVPGVGPTVLRKLRKVGD
jgi:hypothetical protein